MQEMLDGELDQFTEKYHFEQIKTHVLDPEENLFAALNIYVKVALDPTKTYTITVPGDVITNFYLIGNGATVNVTCTENRIFNIRNALAGPMIGGMHTPTIDGVIFCGKTGTLQFGDLICAHTSALVNCCHFIDWDGTCVRGFAALVVRGCMFVGCARGVRTSGEYTLTVKSTSFKCCLVCIGCKTDFEIIHCLFDECLCSLMSTGTGKFIKNSVANSIIESLCRYKSAELVTCAGGNTNMLCGIHIVANTKKVQVKFEDNNFYRAKIFLGFRKGVHTFRRCTLHYCHIWLDQNSADKLSLTGSYSPLLSVSVAMHVDFEKLFTMKCECGVTHIAALPVFENRTEDYKINGRKRSCQCLEFSSDEE